MLIKTSGDDWNREHLDPFGPYLFSARAPTPFLALDKDGEEIKDDGNFSTKFSESIDLFLVFGRRSS